MDRTEANPTILTPDQRLRVFISSTIQELAPERERVRQAVSRLRMTPVYFESGARPHAAQDLYRSYLAQSHIFVGIYWQSYGWVAPDEEISGLEDEYRLSEGLPRLIYIKNPAPERQPRLTELLAKIKSNGSISYKYFQNPEELAELVQNDLALLLTERFAASGQASTGAAGSLASIPFPAPGPAVDRSWSVDLSHFIGREQQVEDILALLRQERVRMVTLTGPGGVGKTRLARKSAAALADDFPDGIYFVDLAPLFDPDLLLTRIAASFGLREATAGSLEGTLAAHLYNRQVLIVLDNFEQILAAAPRVSALLAAAPGVKALVTSREVLRVQGEFEYRVPPMRLPGKGDHSAAQVGGYEAVRLFLERAAERRPLALTDENAPLVAEICRRLDGLPLAIELAAGRTGMLTLPVLLERLTQRMKALSGPRDLPDRQRTLWNTIDWSYQLLNPAEQKLLGRLSVFRGRWTVDAVESICMQAGEEDEAYELLESLLDKNLIQRQPDLGGKPFFSVLETVREFATEKLEQAGDADEIRRRHAQYYLEYIRDMFEQRFMKPEMWSGKMENSIDNARSAIAWAEQQSETYPIAAGIALNLFFYWYTNGNLNEGYHTLLRLTQRQPRPDPELYASLLKDCGMFACWVGKYAESRRYLDEAIELLRTLHSPQVMGQALMYRGVLAVQEGDEEGALPILEEGLSLFHTTRDQMFISVTQMHLANAVMGWFDLPRAQEYLEQALANARAQGDQVGEVWVIALVLNNLGELARMQGDYRKAEALYMESMELLSIVNARGDLTRGLHSLAYTKLVAGDIAGARQYFEQSLSEFRRLSLQRGVCESLAGLARVLALEGKPEQGAALFGYAQSMLDGLALRWWPADRIEINTTRKLLVEKLGSEAFGAHFGRGQALTQKEAFQLSSAEWAGVNSGA